MQLFAHSHIWNDETKCWTKWIWTPFLDNDNYALILRTWYMNVLCKIYIRWCLWCMYFVNACNVWLWLTHQTHSKFIPSCLTWSTYIQHPCCRRRSASMRMLRALEYRQSCAEQCCAGISQAINNLYDHECVNVSAAQRHRDGAKEGDMVAVALFTGQRTMGFLHERCIEWNFIALCVLCSSTVPCVPITAWWGLAGWWWWPSAHLFVVSWRCACSADLVRIKAVNASAIGPGWRCVGWRLTTRCHPTADI